MFQYRPSYVGALSRRGGAADPRTHRVVGSDPRPICPRRDRNWIGLWVQYGATHRRLGVVRDGKAGVLASSYD